MKEIIRAGLAELGLLDQVPQEAPEQLAEYGRLMLEKNQVMNLTAITDPEQAARLHMLDSAALLLCADFQGEKTLIDVGTGAGLPGLPLKILVPSLQVTLLDSLGKRVDWLNQVCAQLGLEGIQAIHARAEEQPDPEDEAGATRAVRSAGRDRWADQPVRSARPIPEDEEDEEDDRDPVAENIIRWVPPVTALICAGIALYGFVYYQFFL